MMGVAKGIHTDWPMEYIAARQGYEYTRATELCGSDRASWRWRLCGVNWCERAGALDVLMNTSVSSVRVAAIYCAVVL